MMINGGYDDKNDSARTVIVVNQDKTLASLSHGQAEWLHPWHIQISPEYSDDQEIYQKLVELHIKEKIQRGDQISGIKNTSLTNVSYFAKIFAGEYEISELRMPNGQIKQILTRVASVMNANIRLDIPLSLKELESELSEHGHVLIRSGEPINEQQIVNLLANNRSVMDYRYGNTARKQVNNTIKAVEVTPWSKELMVSAHNEMTYHTEFPKNMAFLCIEPSESGGETTIYDCAKAFENLSPLMQRKVTDHNVICHKRYTKQTDHSRYPSWQQVLGEGSTCEEAMNHFTSIGYRCIQFQEEEQGEMIDVLETILIRPMVYHYQGKLCLHSSIVPLAPYWYAQLWPEKRAPLSATWDNEEPFTYEEFYEMDEALLLARIRYHGWQKHDVLVIDNLRIAHGRLPFIGKRVIGALMAQPAHFVLADDQWTVEMLA